MPHGWTGKLLRVDLDNRECTVEPSEQYYDQFLGGKGINTKVLWDEVPPEVAPLDPQARLMFAATPLIGTVAPTASKAAVTAKSPATGIYGDSNIGGPFPPAMKAAGFDQVIITGRADKPVYLFLNDGKPEIRDAGHLWGKDAGTTTNMIKQELAGDASSRYVQPLAIGPAGENLVYSAQITSWPGGGASRTGIGAVMGSKNLKAIAAAGTQSVTIARPTELLDLCAKLTAGIQGLRKVVSDAPGEITHHAEYLLYGVADSLPPEGWPGSKAL